MHLLIQISLGVFVHHKQEMTSLYECTTVPLCYIINPVFFWQVLELLRRTFPCQHFLTVTLQIQDSLPSPRLEGFGRTFSIEVLTTDLKRFNLLSRKVYLHVNKFVLGLVHVICTERWMSKLVLNVKYLLLLSFLTAAEFSNLRHIQGIIRVH